MANSISSNPWRIDTAPFTYKFPVKITNLNITDAAVGDHIVVNDINGNTIVDYTAIANQQEYRIGNIGWVRGFVLSSIGAGATAVITVSVGSGK